MFKSLISRPNRIRFSKISCYRPLGPYGFGLCKKVTQKFHACVPLTQLEFSTFIRTVCDSPLLRIYITVNFLFAPLKLLTNVEMFTETLLRIPFYLIGRCSVVPVAIQFIRFGLCGSEYTPFFLLSFSLNVHKYGL
jgi:hypothetical protein